MCAKVRLWTACFRDLNRDPSVHGIIVQMPLDSEQEVQSLIAIIYFLSSTLIRVLASKHKVQNLIASAKKILLTDWFSFGHRRRVSQQGFEMKFLFLFFSSSVISIKFNHLFQDVDGLCTTNQGRVATGQKIYYKTNKWFLFFFQGDLTSGFLPCTPNGCIKLIERTGVKVRFSRNLI